MRACTPRGRADGLGPVRGRERGCAAGRAAQQPCESFLPAGQSAARAVASQKAWCSPADTPIRGRGQGPILNSAFASVALPAGESMVPFEAETWGTPIEYEPEQVPDIPPDWTAP